ncbi:copper amine oxidase N-terminal domain-containing protein [Paenibacillus sp. SN-8-1]|uniref:copper amine oxidase N-terminal domain-containing protein n=1 Tax=Paenibacillus sp. SN-8-1 TaxID=3435409 RepID=UPI003D9A390C
MKKVVSYMLSLILLVTFVLPAAATGTGNAKPVLFVNGQRMMADITPAVDKTGVYVPYKAVFGALGYTASYDAKAKMHILKRASTTIKFTVGGKSAIVNGQKKVLTLSPKLIGSTVYIPLIFMTETIKMPTVDDKVNNIVQIGKAAVVDHFFQLNFGLTPDQVKKLEKNKLSEAGKDGDGNDNLTYYDVTLPNGTRGSISYGFKNGKLNDVMFMFDNYSSDFDAALAAYKQDKVYLDKVYNKGSEANDVVWYSEEDVQTQHAEEFSKYDYDLLATSLTNGDLNLEATYKSTSFSVSINLTNLNSDEEDDPYYMHTISYVKN